ncbi:protein of unknown function [Nocardiopsis flavescens]|uniref:DUF397 domain-containing protein n=1 Tax=Nocardiopsis flavescens TaxID=758803 RepID=A0A1M6S4I3_9ACTN|nr:DUF397 domain-containing protein [Nocardiopsis flavescens]SHK39615.1 protein of unknown function [Nocardiopsis flavescens]
MAKWHKSSYSSGSCVEVAEGTETLIRDTQNRELGHLTFTANEWNALLRTFKTPN